MQWKLKKNDFWSKLHKASHFSDIQKYNQPYNFGSSSCLILLCDTASTVDNAYTWTCSVKIVPIHAAYGSVPMALVLYWAIGRQSSVDACVWSWVTERGNIAVWRITDTTKQETKHYVDSCWCDIELRCCSSCCRATNRQRLFSTGLTSI